MKKDIFISYTTNDEKIAETLVDFIEGFGYKCFFAPRDNRPGQDYSFDLDDAISQAKMVLLVASNSINASKYCLREVGIAVQEDVPIVPVYIEDFPLDKKYMFYLNVVHRLNAFPGNIEKHFAKILKSVEQYCSVKTPEVVFEYLPEKGIMVNPKDKQRNISFRNDTLINLMGGIYEEVVKLDSSETAEGIFYSSGYAGGRNFGDRIKHQWNLGGSMEEIRAKLNKWCEFDSSVGWGKFTINVDYDEESDSITGTLTVNDAFIVDKVGKRKICGFIRGYCTGVIEALLDIQEVKLTCKDCPFKGLTKTACVFEFVIKG